EVQWLAWSGRDLTASCETPTDDDGLTVGAYEDIGRLDVAVDDPSGMGISDGNADCAETIEQVAKGSGASRLGRVSGVEACDCIAQILTGDQRHDEIRALARILTYGKDGDDARVLESGGDHRLSNESLALNRVVDAVRAHLLERDLPIQHLVVGDA